MAQLLFKAQLQKQVQTGNDFYFNDGAGGQFSNRIRISRFQNLLNEQIQETNDRVDLVSLLDVNTFLHTISKTNVNNQQEIYPFVELGAQIVAVDLVNDGTDNIDITISKAVKNNGNFSDEQSDEFVFCFQEFFNRSNRAAIGLDANKPQKVSSLVPLFSTIGEPLTDDFGNLLVAEAEIALVDKIQAENATRVNITPNVKPFFLPIEEQFPLVSEVSNTLLGVPRAETQLSLFSDVSTLGFDDLTWETFKSLNPQRNEQEIGRRWENRLTKSSQRFNAKMVEVIEEQALELSAFPVPYTYPYDQTFRATYKPDEYEKFYKFILLGNYLYTYFQNENYQNDFLDPSIVTVNENDGVLRNSDSDSDKAIQLKFLSEEAAFRAIDIWTDTFIKIRDGNYPNSSASQVFDVVYDDLLNFSIFESLSTFTNVADKVRDGLPNNSFQALREGLSDFYQPGYSWGNENDEVIALQTKEVFRYQPGRISGFTFGTKTDTIPSGGGTVVEWGVENSTDAYLFRQTGGSLSIVRKSTVPLSSQFLEDESLVGRQSEVIGERDAFSGEVKETFFELELNQRDWNGDPLNGNGLSGYSLDPSNVTMWKIEFSWYGAIGAKFYAYIPVGNGEARWVLAHTLIIENKLSKACLEDPFFRMKYQFRLRNRERSSKQQFVYKYGSSVYIDGGDEGTKKQFSYTGDKKLR